MPFFSIIIPVYKTEIYLEKCLDSVKKQIFTDFECIVLDDGSPGIDLSSHQKSELEILESSLDLSSIHPNNQVQDIFQFIAQEDPRFKLISKPNEGQGPTKNRGIQESMGERLVFLDSDDYLDVEFLQTAFKSIKQLKPNQIPYSQIKIFDGEKFYTFESKQKFTPKINSLANTLVFPTWTITGINYFWSAEIIKQNNINFAHKNKAEDTMFVVDNLIAHTKKYPNLELVKTDSYYIYRINQNQITASDGYESELFSVSTSLMQKRLQKLREIGLKYEVLGRLFVLRFSIYRQRLLTKNKLARIILNILAKCLTVLAILIAGTKKA